MQNIDVAYIENLCTKLYNSADTKSANEAQAELVKLISTPEFIPKCQMILNTSTNDYALSLAGKALTNLITTNWNSFTEEQKADIQRYIIDYLVKNCGKMKSFVSSSLIQLYCRVAKLGWNGGKGMADVVTTVSKFMDGTVAHKIIGMNIFSDLVQEIDTPAHQPSTPESRKIAYYFRESHLLDVFKAGINVLQEIKLGGLEITKPEEEINLAHNALQLIHHCLSFDFIGTNPDESGMETGAVYIPLSWRDVIQDPGTLLLFSDLYFKYESPITAQILECLIYLASVRRTVFRDAAARNEFLVSLMKTIGSIINSQYGLDDSDTYHMLCRLLGRLKGNNQLSDLVYLEGYDKWITLVGDFTIKSLEHWESCENSIQYLLTLWNQLVSAVPVLKSTTNDDVNTLFDGIVPRIVESYITNRLASVEIIQNNNLDDPLEHIDNILTEMKQLPSIFRYNYKKSAQFISTVFKPLSLQLNQKLIELARNDTIQLQAEIRIVEGKLTWLINIIGAVIAGQSFVISDKNTGDEIIDADLCSCAFSILESIDYRLTYSKGSSKCDPRLELGLLFFFKKFRQAYSADQYSYVNTNFGSNDFSYKYSMFQTMFDRLGLGDHKSVMNKIIEKIIHNFQFWPENMDIIRDSILVFNELAQGYSSGKLLLTLDPIKNLLINHTQSTFPFLTYNCNMKYRMLYYAGLGRLVFLEGNDSTYQPFFQPFINIMNELTKTDLSQQNNNNNIQSVLVGLFRDWRGILSSASSSSFYSYVYEILKPYFGLFNEVSKYFYNNMEVSSSLFKFLIELACNKQSRIRFNSSSADGIILFKECSNIMTTYGSAILQLKQQLGTNDTPTDYLKSVRYYLQLLITTLIGDYTNFGVFHLYNDPCLDNAIKCSFSLVFSVRFEELLLFPKESYTYFNYIEILFRNHMDILTSLSVEVFGRILETLQFGLKAIDTQIVTKACSTLNNLGTLYYTNRNKNDQTMMFLRSIIPENGQVWAVLLFSLFQVYLFDNDIKNQWQISRPMLPFILINKQSLLTCKTLLMNTQPEDIQIRLQRSFETLLKDFPTNLDAESREIFTTKANEFRTEVKKYIHSASIY